ncbi:hypothetical protein ACLOJK_029707 [Asimina triloba]
MAGYSRSAKLWDGLIAGRWVRYHHRQNLQGMLPDSEGRGDVLLVVAGEDGWRRHGRRISKEKKPSEMTILPEMGCSQPRFALPASSSDQPSEMSLAMGSTVAMSKMMAHYLDGDNVAGVAHR